MLIQSSTIGQVQTNEQHKSRASNSSSNSRLELQYGPKPLTSKQNKLMEDMNHFLAEFKIRQIDQHISQGAFTLPKNKSYLDFVTRAQLLSAALHFAFPNKYLLSQIIHPHSLGCISLNDEYGFNIKGSGKEAISDCRVLHSRFPFNSLSKCERLNILVANLVGRYLLDGHLMIEQDVVRASNGHVSYHEKGIRISLEQIGPEFRTAHSFSLKIIPASDKAHAT